MKDILYFLRQLCVNNNRDWFDANRLLYKEQKESFEAIVNRLIVKISEFDASVSQISAKDCTYRINRDTRFSNDKTPYKNHFGAFISPGGKKSYTAGYYIHIEPDNSIIAGGMYMPPSDILLKLRTAIFERPKEFVAIVENPVFIETFGSIDGEKLISAPRGFSKDFEQLELIKFKSYTVSTSVSDAIIEHGDVEALAIDVFKKMNAFNVFINSSL
jgi:uncharacterized protein (TIGR02453 family)